MKKIILSALLLIQIGAFAQKSSISLGFGSSTPFGEFAQSDVNASGTKLYAKNGGLFELGYTYNLNEKWGLSLDYRFINNPRDISPIVNEMKSFTTVYSSTNGNYTGGGFLVGGFYKIPVTEKVKVHLKASTGFLGVTSNEFEIFTSTTTLTKKQSITSSLSLNLGARVTRPIFNTEKFYGYFGVDFLMAYTNVKNERTTNSKSVTYNDSSYDYMYNNLNFCFGIGYNFIKK